MYKFSKLKESLNSSPEGGVEIAGKYKFFKE
jgi:hypothetical protein